MKTLLIFLHGSGSNGPELRTYLESIPLEDFQHRTFRALLDENHIDLMTPTALERKYSPAGGESMNVWYDRTPNFLQEGLSSIEDIDSVTQSWQRLCHLVKQADEKENYDHFILGGFSMGGGLALHAYYRGLELFPKLRGIFTMGSFLVERSAAFLASKNSSVPLLMMHGKRFSLLLVAITKRFQFRGE
jgi:predicted esterase